MFSSKSGYALNKVFRAVWVGDNESCHTSSVGSIRDTILGTSGFTHYTPKKRCASFCFRCITLLGTKLSLSHFFAGFIAHRMAHAHNSKHFFCFVAMLSAFARFGMFVLDFIAVRLAQISNSQFFACFKRDLRTQTRACNTVNVETLVAKRLKFIKPELLTCRQEVREKHQFDHFIDECVRAILIPCALQFLVGMSLVRKIMAVFLASVLEIESNGGIHATCRNVNKAIYGTGGGGRICIHAAKIPSLCASSWVLARES